jgi:hypothetical protein
VAVQSALKAGQLFIPAAAWAMSAPLMYMRMSNQSTIRITAHRITARRAETEKDAPAANAD